MCRSSVCDFMYSKANVADSFITLPKLPVKVNLPPVPLLNELSMNRISPPTDVQAKPVTTPANSLVMNLYYMAPFQDMQIRHSGLFYMKS